MQDADTTIWLVGTVHALPPGWRFADGDAVAQALTHADTLALELSASELAAAPALLARMADDEPVPTLARRIGAEPAERVRSALAGRAGFAAPDRTESWALAIAISVLRGADAGMDDDAGVETVLTTAMARRGARIVGLERAADQLTAFDTLPDAAQVMMLRDALDPAETLPPRAVAALWERGDTQALDRYVRSEIARNPALSEPVIFARNRRFAAWIAQRMAAPGAVLVAVGAGHLSGPQAVPDLLTADGHRVVRVQ